MTSAPTWSGGVLNSTTVLLDPLPADESATLIRNLVGESVLQGASGPPDRGDR